jgi:acetyl-CoA carboxylase carboxyl transferase subunit beta
MAFEKIRKFMSRKKGIPGDLWVKCPDCGVMIFKKEVEERRKVCAECGYHFGIGAQERIDLLLDEGSFRELWSGLASVDVLKFEGEVSYAKKLAHAKKETGREDACVAGLGRIEGREVVFGLTDAKFMMGSMGSVVGEKVTRCFELATERKLPVIFVSGSGGGARMFEGALSLMQMAKTSAAIARHGEAGGLFISVLTNPTMGGVMASFAALGDVLVAEPKALIGFAGPRVIEQTLKQALPKGFQTSEFHLQHGFIDMISDRRKLKEELASPSSSAGSTSAARRRSSSAWRTGWTGRASSRSWSRFRIPVLSRPACGARNSWPSGGAGRPRGGPMQRCGTCCAPAGRMSCSPSSSSRT